MTRDDAAVLDILRAARLAQTFVAGIDLDSFLADEKTQSAVVHQLLVIGEAAKRISNATRTAHPAVPWVSMAGMRDKLIHEYDEVDLEEVWQTVVRDLPPLIAALALLSSKTP
jgi:uncharacterized protein with HEPN domain